MKVEDNITPKYLKLLTEFISVSKIDNVKEEIPTSFIPKYMTNFLQTRIYMGTKNPIYLRYRQACGIWGYRKSSYKRHRIIPSAKNMKHDLESLLEQIGFSSFLSLERIIALSSPRTRLLSLLVSKLFILSPHSPYNFHVCSVVVLYSHNLSAFHLPLHFNHDFHDYLTRSRSTCIICPSGINLLLVLKPRLFRRIFYL